MSISYFFLSRPFNYVPVYRRVKPCLGSLTPNPLHQVQPEEPFEQFETVRESGEEPATVAKRCSDSNNTSKSCASKVISSQDEHASSAAPSQYRCSALLSSPSHPDTVATSREDVGKLSEITEASEGIKGNKDDLGTSYGSMVTAGVGSLIGLRGSPRSLGGFRGAMGGKAIGRPSTASRLSSVDRKWLERCQVFGEMGAEERPGAGNQEIDLTRKVENGEWEGGKEDKKQGDDRLGKGAMVEEGVRREAGLEGDGGVNSSIIDSKVIPPKLPKPGVRKEKKENNVETETVVMQPPSTEDESSGKSKGTKPRGRKRQREGDDVDGEMTEVGAVKKRKRKGKTKEEDSGVNPSPAPEGGRKKRKTKKKGNDDDGEEEKETPVPKKVGVEFIPLEALRMSS